MTVDPLSRKALIVSCVAAILFGAGVAACQHQDDDDSPAVSCTNVVYVRPAPPKPRLHKAPAHPAPPKPQLRKGPAHSPQARRNAHPPRKHTPAVSPSPTVHHKQPHIELDLDMDGC